MWNEGMELGLGGRNMEAKYGRKVGIPFDGRCVECGSQAINPHMHGRDYGIDLDLCDVCYWMARAEPILSRLAKLERVAEAAQAYLSWTQGEARGDDGHARYDRLCAALAALKEE
jgi:hypothetical protein